MKELVINKTSSSLFTKDLNSILETTSKELKLITIDTLPWKNSFPYLPSVQLRTTYADDKLLLNFKVTEKHILAKHELINQPVSRDSCVEFFVSVDNKKTYYNFEFNCIGTCLAGFGSSQKDLKLIDTKIIESIKTFSTLGNKPFSEKTGTFTWSIVIVIPASVFFMHNIKSFEDKIFHANFYKCGDRLSTPHYVCWNTIETPNPSFHQPEYFGKITFN